AWAVPRRGRGPAAGGARDRRARDQEQWGGGDRGKAGGGAGGRGDGGDGAASRSAAGAAGRDRGRGARVGRTSGRTASDRGLMTAGSAVGSVRPVPELDRVLAPLRRLPPPAVDAGLAAVGAGGRVGWVSV